MAKKSSVRCLSVLKADPATRSGMIDVLKTLSPLCPVNQEGKVTEIILLKYYSPHIPSGKLRRWNG